MVCPGHTADSPPPGPARRPAQASVTALPGRGEKDAALMCQVRDSGDRSAFAELAGHYAPRLKAWLTKRGECGSTAEDIVQEVLVIAWHKAALFDPAKASFSTWAFRLTRNKWIDHKRKHGRMIPTAPETMSELAGHAAGHSHAELERAEAAAAVRQELALLPQEQQRMLYLAFFEGLSHSQIAERTGVALGTVKSRIRMPLKRLQHKLRDFEGDKR